MTKWTDEEVAALVLRQLNNQFHPYTCPGTDARCTGKRELIPTNDGWVCDCGAYTQDWAHQADMAVQSDTTGMGLSRFLEQWNEGPVPHYVLEAGCDILDGLEHSTPEKVVHQIVAACVREWLETKKGSF